MRKQQSESKAAPTQSSEGPAARDVRVEFRPQPGPQTAFLTSTADIAIYGGAAGGGKSYALLLEPVRHLHVPGFGAVIFRRTYPDICREGGLWDTSEMVYPFASGGSSGLGWYFPSGARITFAHMQHAKNRFDWQGAQIPLICFDEITHFTEAQFWYMVARSRSTCGVRPYIRATCNPDPDSFVAALIAWWIDQETGFPIKERSGVVRWFVRSGDELHWADDPQALRDKFGPESRPKSLTFIPSRITDNQILLDKDPDYMANLLALPKVERMRLLEGNWKIRPAAGRYYRKDQFEIHDAAPPCPVTVRYWDLAGTDPTRKRKNGTTNPDPDWTCGLKLGRDDAGRFWVLDVTHVRGAPFEVERTIKATASQDGQDVEVWVEQDPGQAGVAQVEYYVRTMAGYSVRGNAVHKDKVVRAGPSSSQAEIRNIHLVRGRWNDAFLTELENFPDGDHDDMVDGLTGAMSVITDGVTVCLA